MRAHVEAESLARYAEGLLGRRGTARVRAHLSGCAECRRTAAQLTDVSTRLSQVPAPLVPSAVAARLDAALSAESARRAAEPGAAEPGTPAPAPRPPRRNPRWSPAALRILAATGVTLVAAGGIGYAVAQSGSSGPSSASSASSGAAGPPPHRSAVKAGPNVSPGGHDIHSGLAAPNNPGGNIGTSRYVRSGTDYQRRTLARQAVLVAAKSRVSAVPGVARLSPNVATCVTRTARQRPVTMVDLARYDQHPAVVMVLGGSPGKVIAVSYSCAELDSAPLTVTSTPGAG
ncbi:MAG: anti-sigma factor family protein [Streptosporangiaceae bacterium]